MPHSVSIHRYTLRSKTALNARSVKSEHEGTLIRVDGGEGHFGYGCIHPWVELGDLDLEATLEKLSQGETTALSRRALRCAGLDADARSRGVSLFEGLTVPESHATLMADSWCVMEAVDAGFKIAKLKVGKSLSREIFFIREQALAHPELRWRLDFNHTQSLEAIRGFLTSLGDTVRGRIDFLEDAGLPHEAMDSGTLGHVSLAIDRFAESGGSPHEVIVIKPALNDPAPLLERAKTSGKRVVFTSYMDHPLGQCFAAYEAGVAYAHYSEWIDTCGLITHGLFEKDAELDRFRVCMGSAKPEFPPPKGTGLGFDELLESLAWQKLI